MQKWPLPTCHRLLFAVLLHIVFRYLFCNKQTSIYLTFHLSVFLSFFLSIYLSIYLSIHKWYSMLCKGFWFKMQSQYHMGFEPTTPRLPFQNSQNWASKPNTKIQSISPWEGTLNLTNLCPFVCSSASLRLTWGTFISLTYFHSLSVILISVFCLCWLLHHLAFEISQGMWCIIQW